MIKKLCYLILLTTGLLACKKTGEEQPTINTPAEITSIAPKDPKPGDVVVITGKGFGTAMSDVKLSIANTVLTISSITNTEIRFSLPSGISEGQLMLLVKNIAALIKDPQGAKISPKPADLPAPTFQLIDPNKGKVGDVITVTGTGFSTTPAENKVSFTSATATSPVLGIIKSATATSIKVEVPVGSITGLVTVETKGITAVRAASFDGIFTVETSVPNNNGSGTVTYHDQLKTHAYFAANDNQGNWFTLNPTGSGHRFYKIIKINAAGTVTKTFEPAEFVAGATQLFINGITNDADGTIWVVAGLSKNTAGKLFKIVKNTEVPVFVKDITGGDLLGLDVSAHFFDFVVNSKKEVFFIDANYKVYNLSASGTIQLYINPWVDLVSSNPLSAIGLSFDAQDNLYLATINGGGKLNRIYKVTPAKAITPIYQATEYGFADGALAQAKFQQLGSIAVDQAGTTLYIADGHGFRLRKLDLATSTVSTLAGNGTPITTTSKMQGPALESVVGPAKISLSEAKKEIYLQNGSDYIYQIYHY
jgi:hypothetical protein